jgi:membrane protease YdiL (CAAX protease family)
VLGLVLQPPAANDGGFYNMRFGVVVLGSYAALVGATVVIANRYGDPRPRLALRRTPVGRTAGIVVATFGAAVVASLALEPIFHGVKAQDVDPGPFPGGAAATAGIILAVLGVAVAAPIAEELYFRGLLQGALGAFGQPVAVVGTAALFAGLHFVPAAIPVLFVYGLLLGLIRSKTNSIVPGVIAHALNNGVAIAVAIALA